MEVLGGEDGAECDLAEWPAERVCDLTQSIVPFDRPDMIFH